MVEMPTTPTSTEFAGANIVVEEEIPSEMFTNDPTEMSNSMIMQSDEDSYDELVEYQREPEMTIEDTEVEAIDIEFTEEKFTVEQESSMKIETIDIETAEETSAEDEPDTKIEQPDFETIELDIQSDEHHVEPEVKVESNILETVIDNTTVIDDWNGYEPEDMMSVEESSDTSVGTDKEINTQSNSDDSESTVKIIPVTAAHKPVKRTADVALGNSVSNNIAQKIIVSQDKKGNPILLARPVIKQLALVSGANNIQSPVKSVTFEQAKQMGLFTGKLQAIRPAVPKISSKNFVGPASKLASVPSGQNVNTSGIPSIVSRSLVTNSSNAMQSQKVFVKHFNVLKQSSAVTSTSDDHVTTIPAQIGGNSTSTNQVQFVKVMGSSTSLSSVLNAANASISKTENNIPNANIKIVNVGSQAHLSKTVTDSSGMTFISTLQPAKNRLLLPAQVNNRMKLKPIFEKDPALLDALKNKIKSRESPTFVIMNSDDGVIKYESDSSDGPARSKKPCNCTRSQCLKLYCECFANGEFCFNCNCIRCFNNANHEENRLHAIRSCLDRNPLAFKPKIIGKSQMGVSDRMHTKGCNCKRSGCLKNYCECYEAQIPCSDNCRCIGCKNVDEMLFAAALQKLPRPIEIESQTNFQTKKNRLTEEINDAADQAVHQTNGPRHAFSFVKQQVVEATCQCLLAQAEETKRKKIDVEVGKQLIIEEFGRCLVQIIECAKKSYDNLPEQYLNS